MTDIEALVAEALADVEEDRFEPSCLLGECDHEGGACPEPYIGCGDATTILATPAGRTIARLAAIGEAVERLLAAPAWGTETRRIEYDEQGDMWYVRLSGYTPREAYGPTITSAINAALEGGG